MILRILFPALGLIALVFYLAEKTRRYTLKAVFLKTLVSILFVALGVCGAYRALIGSRAILAPFVVTGLFFGLLGDVWLDLKYVYPQQDRAYTLAGFCSFGLGHVLYLTGLSLQARTDAKTLLSALLIAALGTLLVLLSEKPMKLRYGALKPVVVGYGLLLFGVVGLSALIAIGRGLADPCANLFFAGAVLFALSDLILSGTYFGEGRERPVDLILNYLTYYPGQYLIALSLFFLR